MADPMWSGGPDQFQDRYPDVWAVLPSFMRDPFYPQTPPLSALAMSGVCLLMMQVSIFGAYGGYAFGQYQIYYGDAYRSSPPGSHTDDVPSVSVPDPYSPPTVGGPNYDWILGQINGGVLTILDYLGPWYSPDNLHVQIQAIEDTLAGITGGTPGATHTQAALILAGIYYLAQAPIAYALTIDDAAILQAISDARDALDVLIDTHDANLNGARNDIAAIGNDVDGLVTALADVPGNIVIVDGKADDILAAIAGIEPGGGGPGGWPGLGSVTLSDPVALTDQLRLVGPMDGVVIAITTPPTKTGLYLIGGATYDYKVGEVAFETDRGDMEPWQYLGFRNALFTPKSMTQAAAVRFRVLAGAAGTVRAWTAT